MSEAPRQRSDRLRPVQLMKRAARLYAANWRTMLLLAAMGMGPGAAAIAITLSGSNLAWWAGQSLLAPTAVLNLWAAAAMIFAASDACRGQKPAAADCIERVSGLFGWFAMALALYGVVCQLGFFFLVLPVFYLSTVFTFAPCAAVLEGGESAGSPLKRSWRIVRGHFWPVFRVMLMLWGAFLTGAAAVGAAVWLGLAGRASVLFLMGLMWLLWPLWTTARVSLYRELTAPGTEVPRAEWQAPGRRSWILASLAVVGGGLAGGALAAMWTILLEGA